MFNQRKEVTYEDVGLVVRQAETETSQNGPLALRFGDAIGLHPCCREATQIFSHAPADTARVGVWVIGKDEDGNDRKDTSYGTFKNEEPAPAG